MSKKKGLPFNNLEIVRDTKEHFLSLCVQYERMGKLFALQSKAMSHPVFKPSSVPQIHGRLLEQYHEIGEEMKNIGTLLDLMGGKPVLKEKGDPRKSQVEKEMEIKEGSANSAATVEPKEGTNQTFVSNIQPEEKEEKKEEKEKKEENGSN